MITTKIQEKIDKFLRVALHGDLPDNIQVHQISDYAAEIGLYPYAKKIPTDFKGLTTQGRIGLVHFFIGSIGEDLANHVNFPAMTFRIQI